VEGRHTAREKLGPRLVVDAQVHRILVDQAEHPAIEVQARTAEHSFDLYRPQRAELVGYELAIARAEGHALLYRTATSTTMASWTLALGACRPPPSSLHCPRARASAVRVDMSAVAN
jgi:hypothetical protein